MRWYYYFLRRVIAALQRDATNNYLGFAIWIIEPALMMAVFYVVFGVFLQRGGEGFSQFLLVGIVSWLWFASAVNRCVTSILSARHLILQVYVPKVVLPLIDIAVCTIKQIVVFLLLLIFLLVVNSGLTSWLFLPFVFLAQLLLICACGLSVAAMVPFIPDLRAFVPPLLQMLMFCSGVFYRVTAMPEAIQKFFLFNPVANLIFQYRLILIEGEAPQFLSLAVISLSSIFVGALAYLFLHHYDRIYPRVVI